MRLIACDLDGTLFDPEGQISHRTAATGATQAIKLMMFHSVHSAHELLNIVPPLLGADAVELGPAGVDKATGLAWLCASLGIDAADVVAFGDEYNDHEMVLWAGLGVAMGNAADVTKACADEVTLTNAEDGAAVVVERLLAASALR